MAVILKAINGEEKKSKAPQRKVLLTHRRHDQSDEKLHFSCRTSKKNKLVVHVSLLRSGRSIHTVLFPGMI